MSLAAGCNIAQDKISQFRIMEEFIKILCRSGLISISGCTNYLWIHNNLYF